MTPLLRKMHKWLGLLIGLQFVVWLASGTVMSLLNADKVAGRQFRIKAESTQPWPESALPAASLLTAAPASVRSISTAWLLGQPVYVLDSEAGIRLYAALTGRIIEIDAQFAKRIAAASYSGDGAPGEPRLLANTTEARNHTGPVWVVDFADNEDTSVYLSASTGTVLEHRNRTWRLFDVFWMLHIMDYSGRKDFNNPLVIAAGIGGLWLALTGLWLLGTSLRLSEFIPRRLRGSRTLNVHEQGQTIIKTLSSSAGDTVFFAMARSGLMLPSNCGGGQSCGLCSVRVLQGLAPPTGADRVHLSTSQLDAGYRLACNLIMDRDHAIEVPDLAALTDERWATVVAARDVAPFLREIVLQPDEPLDTSNSWRPGSYVQVHIPTYCVKAADLAKESLHVSAWEDLGLSGQLDNATPVRRAYSLACPLQDAGGNLTLLVRFMGVQRLGEQSGTGVGSTYMYTLEPGDQVRYSGPYGDFKLMEEEGEKIFIGGGAGMAPLRAMLRSLLARGTAEPIHFWYGARTLHDAPYVDEMQALAREHDNFSWNLVLSGVPEKTYGVMTGMVHEAAYRYFLRDHPDLAACQFYLCGPPAMLLATRQLLNALKIDDSRVSFDDFKV